MFGRARKSVLWREVSDHKAGLALWLDIATDGLCAAAKERVRLEIEGHYTEAVAAHITDDFPERISRAAALTELGDANDARRRFRKQHLTKRESVRLDEILRNLQNLPSLPSLLKCYGILASQIIILAFFGHGHSNRHWFALIFSILLFMLAVMPTIGFALRRYYRAKQRMHVLLNWQFVEFGIIWGVCIPILLGLFWPGDNDGSWIVFIAIYASYSSSAPMMIIREFRLWRKLRRRADLWNELSSLNKQVRL
jgi:hypothetical protein